MQVMKVLIIGSKGFVGSAMERILSKEKNLEIHCLHHYKFDITDEEQVTENLRLIRPHAVVNCTGVTGKMNCDKEPDYAQRVNVEAATMLARLCRPQHIHLVHMSSVVVFPGTKNDYQESDVPQPLAGNLYAETKAKAEANIQQIGGNITIVRATTAYGPENDRHTSTNFLGLVADRLRKGIPWSYYYDQWFRPVHVYNIAYAVRVILNRKYHGVIHLAGNEALTAHDFACMIKNELGLSGEIEAACRDPKYPEHVTLDNTLAKRLGIPFVELREGIRNCRKVRRANGQC